MACSTLWILMIHYRAVVRQAAVQQAAVGAAAAVVEVGVAEE